MDPELRETVDYLAVRRLQDAYADVVNRRVWAELEQLFRPDCEIVLDTRTGSLRSIVGPAALGDFLDEAMARFEFFEFVVLSTRVVLDPDIPDSARARLYMCELRQGADDGRGSVAFGVYHDDYIRRDDRWWFAHRRYHSLARTAPDLAADLAVFPFPDVTPGFP
ncbi:MAG: nuclear transport factor 2 family protein [Acidimicrobiia bacterium]